MVTYNQLLKKTRKKKKRTNMVKALGGSPQKKGVCVRVFTTKPKKPNSAIRKVARVRLTSGRLITVAIPGIGHSLQQFSTVLVRGGRANDLPGVRYKLIRGVYDFTDKENIKRGSRRSKFGVKK